MRDHDESGERERTTHEAGHAAGSHDGHDGHDHHDHDHDHDHDRGHHHHHGHGGIGHVHVHVPEGSDPRRALAVALGLNGLFLVVEAGVGWWSGSLALLSDAAHMASDVAALALALGAAQLARRPAAPERTFGWRRAEVLGGFTNAVLLLVACGWIVFEAVERMASGPPDVPGVPMLVVAAVGLLINLGAAYALWREGHEDLNVRGALAHMLADALGSVGAMLAAVLVMAGYPIADPVISVLVALLVAWGTVSLVRVTARVLLQLPPPGFDVRALREAVHHAEAVRSIHDLHVWTLDGIAPILTAHVVADADADLEEVRVRIDAVLSDRFGVRHATLQLGRGAPCLAPEGCGG